MVEPSSLEGARGIRRSRNPSPSSTDDVRLPISFPARTAVSSMLSISRVTATFLTHPEGLSSRKAGERSWGFQRDEACSSFLRVGADYARS